VNDATKKTDFVPAAALMLARTMAEDTPVKVKRPVAGTMVLPKGSRIIFELVGMCERPPNNQLTS
jgi:hypothetical protein